MKAKFINEYFEPEQDEYVQKNIKSTYTREEVISLLEDLYMETAGSFNDYGRFSHQYSDEAIIAVKDFMKDK